MEQVHRSSIIYANLLRILPAPLSLQNPFTLLRQLLLQLTSDSGTLPPSLACHFRLPRDSQIHQGTFFLQFGFRVDTQLFSKILCILVYVFTQIRLFIDWHSEALATAAAENEDTLFKVSSLVLVGELVFCGDAL